MTSAVGQPQFRYSQPPSKVVHLRNLPWECSEEEIVEICKPFGTVVNTKMNVGANRNQAFVEFGDLNQAISMVSYYASAAEPAQIRGKTVYFQYSNRQEIINSKSSGEVASNVLLVSIEGVEAGDVSIDVLHLVFSAFGLVHKIATFEKSAGFQALVQYSDGNTASLAKTALDGRSIPRYLLTEKVGPCSLRISFSAHNDLNVKFQSQRSRDYMNPFLPVASSAIDSTGQCAVGPDGKRKEPESNVLLASIENMQFAVSVDVLHAVFSAFGTVQKIAIFEKNAGFQALVQYPDVSTAMVAKEALEGHCIYDGGYCKLHLSYSRHTDLNVKVNNDRSRDYTNPSSRAIQTLPSVLGEPPYISANTSSTAIGGSSIAPTAYPLNQFLICPPYAHTIARPQLQGWESGLIDAVSGEHITSQIAGSASDSTYGRSVTSVGTAAFGGMLPFQSGPLHLAHSGGSSGPPTPVPTSQPLIGQWVAGTFPVGGSNLQLGPPPSPTVLSSNQQPMCILGPASMPQTAMMPSLTRPSTYYM